MIFGRKLRRLGKRPASDPQAAVRQALEARIGYKFKKPELYKLAMLHRSASCAVSLVEHPYANERLEFLGDSVLSLAVSTALMQRQDLAEGDLSRLRSALVSERALAQVSREIDLGRCVSLSAAEHKSGGRDKDSILSDAFEALLGAIFLDGGYEAAAGVVHKVLANGLSSALEGIAFDDFKTCLQELSQSQYRSHPVYRLTSETGPAHARLFGMEVRVGGKVCGFGQGASKKEAAQNAAREAIEHLQGRM